MSDVTKAPVRSSLQDLVEDLAVKRNAGRLVIGIAGAPGAGKTTLAELLVNALGPAAAHVPMDGFHLADVELDRLGLRTNKGAPETFDPAGYAALLHRIRCERANIVYAPSFERTMEQPIAGGIPIHPHQDIVVTEGNYLLLPEPQWEKVRQNIDEVWFVTVDDDVRRKRLISRHVRFGKEPEEAQEWVALVDEKNARLVDHGKKIADRIIDMSSWPAS